MPSSSVLLRQENCTDFQRLAPDSHCYNHEEKQDSTLLFPGMNPKGLSTCEAATGKFAVQTVPLLPFVHMTQLDPVNCY